MYTLLAILMVLVSAVLILFILVQNSKGGGLASGFSTSNQFGGVVQTNKFLEKGTWILASVILGLCLITSMSVHTEKETKESILKSQINKSPDFNSPVTIPTKQGETKK